MPFDARQFFTDFVAALNGRDREKVRSLVHRDFVSALPQSGERSPGFDAFWAQLEMYPGGAPEVPRLPETRLVGDEERWAITPAYTVVPLASASEFTAIVRARYPGDSLWTVISLLELRDEKLYRMEFYFAPDLPAPLAESIPAYVHRETA